VGRKQHYENRVSMLLGLMKTLLFAGKTHTQQWPQLYVGIDFYLVVRSNSLVISMAGLMDTATGQLSSYTLSTRSMLSRSFSCALRCSVCLILLSTRTLFSVSTSPTVSA
jgi:hypothetical protein